MCWQGCSDLRTPRTARQRGVAHTEVLFSALPPVPGGSLVRLVDSHPVPSVGWKGWDSVSYSALYPSSGVHITFHTQTQTPDGDPLHRSCWCFLSRRHVMRLWRSEERRVWPWVETRRTA